MDEGYANVCQTEVVRTITDGDEAKITGLGGANTLEDQTLGWLNSGAVTVSPNSGLRELGQPYLRRRLQSLDLRFGSQPQLVNRTKYSTLENTPENRGCFFVLKINTKRSPKKNNNKFLKIFLVPMNLENMAHISEC